MISKPKHLDKIKPKAVTKSSTGFCIAKLWLMPLPLRNLLQITPEDRSMPLNKCNKAYIPLRYSEALSQTKLNLKAEVLRSEKPERLKPETPEKPTDRAPARRTGR